jgi:hypothetical protein
MKIFQKPLRYEPICIEFSTEIEAKLFINIIENIDLYQYKIDSPERNLINRISNMFSDGNINIPNYNRI